MHRPFFSVVTYIEWILGVINICFLIEIYRYCKKIAIFLIHLRKIYKINKST